MRRPLILGLSLALVGCAGERLGPLSGAVAAGAGAAAGSVIAPGKPLAAAGGAAAGLLGVTAVDQAASGSYQRGLDDGYLIGSSDAVKRLYWAKQALERKAPEAGAPTLEGLLEAYEGGRGEAIAPKAGKEAP